MRNLESEARRCQREIAIYEGYGDNIEAEKYKKRLKAVKKKYNEIAEGSGLKAKPERMRMYKSQNAIAMPKNGGIIKSAPASIYANSSDELFEYAKNIQLMPEYEDMVIHGDSISFQIKNKDGIPIENYTAVEFAEILRQDPNYHGGDIRLIACEAGAGEFSVAQILANELNVNVLAPTDIVWVSPDGKLSVGPTEFENTGKWKLFKPKRS